MKTPHTSNESQPTSFEALSAKLEAMELLLQQITLVLECEQRFTAEKLHHWSGICIDRMLSTGSAAPQTVAALQELRKRVTA